MRGFGNVSNEHWLGEWHPSYTETLETSSLIVTHANTGYERFAKIL